MHSEGINAGEMKHGPLALVDDKLPIVVVSTMVGWGWAWLAVLLGILHAAGWKGEGRGGRQMAAAGAERMVVHLPRPAPLVAPAVSQRSTRDNLLTRPFVPPVCPRPARPAPQDTMHSKMAGVIQQLMARNGRLIVIANEEDDEMVDIVAGKYPIIAGEPGREV